MGYSTVANRQFTGNFGGGAGFEPVTSPVREISDQQLMQQDDQNFQRRYGFQQQKDLASIPVNAQMERFNAVLPYLTGQLGGMQSMFANAGGQGTPAPEMSVGGVLNPQQIQQQVNQSRAGNDKATAGRIRDTNASVAGRGFGSNSPLAMALNQGTQNQNLATNTQNETNTRLGAAQQNAGQLLNTQQARSNQWAQGQELDIKRRAPVFGYQNSLIAALAGIA